MDWLKSNRSVLLHRFPSTNAWVIIMFPMTFLAELIWVHPTTTSSIVTKTVALITFKSSIISTLILWMIVLSTVKAWTTMKKTNMYIPVSFWCIIHVDHCYDSGFLLCRLYCLKGVRFHPWLSVPHLNKVVRWQFCYSSAESSLNG